MLKNRKTEINQMIVLHFIFLQNLNPVLLKRKSIKEQSWDKALLDEMSLVTGKPVFGVCDQGRLKPAFAATEIS